MNPSKLIEILRLVAEKIKDEKDFLTDLDRPIGDSDHGINMARGFEEVEKRLDTLADKDIGAILKSVGMGLVSKVGGASGPLYGTFFMKMGGALNGKEDFTMEDFLEAFKQAIDGVMQRGRSVPGEKTMLDSMVPAYEEMKKVFEAKGDPKEALKAGASASERAVEHTKDLVATKGRASYLGERSIGHQDPGATSFMFMIQVVSENY